MAITEAWPRASLAAALGVALVFASACDGSEGAADTPEPSGVGLTYTQHIEPILDARCGPCHQPDGIGTFPLLSYDDALKWASVAAHAVETSQMPPFPPVVDGCAKIDDPRRMTADERQMFLNWVADGSPQGDPDASPAYQVPTTVSGDLGEPTHRMPLDVEYVAPVEVTEEYRCFRIDPLLTEPRSFRAVHVDTSTWDRYHQARVYVVPPTRVAEINGLDGADGRPGWPCYFNAGIAGLQPIGRFLPGLPFAPLPANSAVTLEPGTQFVVDAYLHHYDFEPLDLSVVAWEADSREAPPTVVELSDESFVIPPGIDSFVTELRAEVVDAGSAQAGTSFDAGRIWSVDVHMHHRGRSAQVELVRADGGRECLLRIPDWDEEWQGAYQLAEPVEARPGDRIEASCEWGNGPDDQPLVRSARLTPVELTWGLGELDEMCTVRLTLTP